MLENEVFQKLMFHKLVLLDYIPAGKIHVTHIPTLPAEA
jgi:hypothetical protein